MTGYEITMNLEEVTQTILRKIIIPTDISFDMLHKIISTVFNFNTDNKYFFRFNNPDMEIKNTNTLNRDNIDARYEKIDKYLQGFNTLTYQNDFWIVSITVSVIDYDKNYPQIVTYKGYYNPISELKSSNELSYLLELKKNKKEANEDELKKINNFHRINKLKIQKNLMILFNVPYSIRNKRITEINTKSTLNNLL